MIIRLLIVPLTLAVATFYAGQAFAQSESPAPLAGQTEAPANNASPFPSGGAAPFTGSAFGLGPAPPPGGSSDGCTSGFVPLRNDAEKRGKLIKEASDRHARPDEACKLIASFAQAEIKMIKYVDTNSANCGIPPRISEQLRTAHNNTEAVLQQVCAVAQQAQERREPPGPTGDFPPYNYQ